MRKLVAAEIRRGRRRVVAPAVAIVIAVAFVTLTLGAGKWQVQGRHSDIWHSPTVSSWKGFTVK